jgi:alkanesulfonate monooxygenase SsuD/methylene tetrahydromethanopterin reductase-like flavin-dependent oxidoreductase (luciferase family)
VTSRRAVALTPMETRRDVIVRAALLADELGYEIFALPEGWGLDPVPVLTEIALRTTRINLASGVLSVWGRTPATLAMTAATLRQVCGGRYVLGLGASTKALAEGFHDTAFEHPAAKLRDVVTKVRALLVGQPAQLSHAPAAVRCAWASRPPPRYLSGSRRWAITRSGWPPSSVTAGSPRWWPGIACPAGRPSSASYVKPPHHTRGPSRSRPGPSRPPTKTPPWPGASPQAAPPGT